jgi:hypothetical protein
MHDTIVTRRGGGLMESKVNPILKLTNAGRGVEGSGPIDKWKKLELSAMVTFVIVQPQPTGKQPPAQPVQLVIAAGASDRFKNGTANWWAAGDVLPADPPLIPGAALAYARALIEYEGGVLEPYDWEVHVVLEL